MLRKSKTPHFALSRLGTLEAEIAFHSKDELLAYLGMLSQSMWDDGLVVDCPKRRRRSEALGKKQIRITLDADLQKRLIVQFERRVSRYGKDIAYAMIADRLNEESDEALAERAGGD